MLKARNISILVILAICMSIASLCVSFSCFLGTSHTDGVASLYAEQSSGVDIKFSEIQELATLSTDDYFLKKPTIKDNKSIGFGLVLNHVGSYAKFTFYLRNDGQKIGRIVDMKVKGLENNDSVSYKITGISINDVINVSEEKKVTVLVSYVNSKEILNESDLMVLDHLELILDIE